MSALDIYKVGIMSGVAWVEAPSAKAAALFYGMRTGGNAQLMIVVYDRNGKFVEADDTLPWGKFVLLKDADEDELSRELDAIKPELEQCRLVPSPKALKAARLFLDASDMLYDKDALELWAWKVDKVLEGEE